MFQTSSPVSLVLLMASKWQLGFLTALLHFPIRETCFIQTLAIFDEAYK
jgi:hypothetical protein